MMGKVVLACALFAGSGMLGASAKPAKADPAWTKLLVWVKSTHDGTQQPCYFWAPEAAKTNAVPLIVGLHTWSYDYKATSHYQTVLDYARAHGWAMVGPNFRGANKTPPACGGDPAVQDIVDAVNYAKTHAKIDPARVYIAGGSGGGHMTLLMLGRHPEIFAAGAAFCPITDLARWHADSLLKHPGRGKNYAKMLEKACGGTPAEKPEEYRRRSPLTWLDRAKEAGVAAYIVTGIHDGWKGSHLRRRGDAEGAARAGVLRSRRPVLPRADAHPRAPHVGERALHADGGRARRQLSGGSRLPRAPGEGPPGGLLPARKRQGRRRGPRQVEHSLSQRKERRR